MESEKIAGKSVQFVQKQLTSFVDLDGDVNRGLLARHLLAEVLVELELLRSVLEVIRVHVVDLREGQSGVVVVTLDGVAHGGLQILKSQGFMNVMTTNAI